MNGFLWSQSDPNGAASWIAHHTKCLSLPLCWIVPHRTNHSQVQSPSPFDCLSSNYLKIVQTISVMTFAVKLGASPFQWIIQRIIANFFDHKLSRISGRKLFCLLFTDPCLLKVCFLFAFNHHHHPVTTGWTLAVPDQPTSSPNSKFTKHGNGTPAVLELQQLQRLWQFQSSKW